MKQYIGTKLIEAEPCAAWKDMGENKVGDPGYKVKYKDGYASWSPKEIFEKAYIPLSVNRNLKTSAPSISPQMVDDFILETWTHTLGAKTTVVRALLVNGFEIVESSSCVSLENYDEAMGRAICIEKIKDKIWMLLGFLLQTAVGGVKP